MNANSQAPAIFPFTPVNGLSPGTRLHEYEVRGVIGEGGFGIVYLAFDTLLEREVAIKEYLPVSLAVRADGGKVRVRSPEQQALFSKGLGSFVDEARTLARFKHPALVEVLRFWEDHGTAYMVMPYYRGQTLREKLHSEGRLEEDAALLKILLPLLDGLAQMHAVRCYHRDISSDNIMLLETGSPLLLDFGAARSTLTNHGGSSTVILKPGFAPIEQYSGDESLSPQGPWTDLYALCAVAYQLVTATMPCLSVARVMRDPLVPLRQRGLSGFSDAVLGAIDRGLAVDPVDRPQSVAAFRQLLVGDVPEEVPGEGKGSNDNTPDGRPTVAERTVAENRPEPVSTGNDSAGASGRMLAHADRDATGPQRPDEGIEPSTSFPGAGRITNDGPEHAACTSPANRPLAKGKAAMRRWLAASGALALLIALAIWWLPSERMVSDEVAQTAPAQTAPAQPPPASRVEGRLERGDEMPAPAMPEPAMVEPAMVESAMVESAMVESAMVESERVIASESARETVVEAFDRAPFDGERSAETWALGWPEGASTPDSDFAWGGVESGIADEGWLPAPAPSLLIEHTELRPDHSLPLGLESEPVETETAAHENAAPVAGFLEPTDPTPPPPAKGSIEVVVAPWGNVYLNGVSVATVPPRVRLEVSPGTVEIEIRNETHEPHVQRIQVQAGETRRIEHVFSARVDHRDDQGETGEIADHLAEEGS